uniref:Uncharacterized protein n=1 Tax=Anguilla anguilla TaxID=7936 RepID=A0A0E9V8P3_ANGAN
MVIKAVSKFIHFDYRSAITFD